MKLHIKMQSEFNNVQFLDRERAGRERKSVRLGMVLSIGYDPCLQRQAYSCLPASCIFLSTTSPDLHNLPPSPVIMSGAGENR